MRRQGFRLILGIARVLLKGFGAEERNRTPNLRITNGFCMVGEDSLGK